MIRIVYRFLALTITLLILYALLSLVVGLKFLPGDVTQLSLPFNRVSELAAALLDLALTGGLLGGGIYATLVPDSWRDERLPRIALYLWLLLIILTIGAGILNLLISLNPIFALLKVIIMALVLIDVTRNLRHWTPIALVWTVGVSLSALCTLIGLISTGDFFIASALHTLASGVNIYVAQVLAAVALGYWVIGRFSTVSDFWQEMSLYTVAGLLTLAGTLVTLSALDLNLGWLSTLTAALVPLLTLIFASHTYLAFSNRNTSNTLAAHWMALGVLLILLSIGLLGGLQAVVYQWTAGTQLSDLQPTLAQFAVAAILFGVINQIVFEMRKQERRVTGLAPFWLVAFGMIGGGLALADAGLVQVYLERVIGLNYLETQALIAPLYALWIFGLALMSLGLLLYGFIHWLRRPHFEP